MDIIHPCFPSLSCVAVDGSTMRSSPLRELHLKGTHIILFRFTCVWCSGTIPMVHGDRSIINGNEDDVMQGSVDVQKQGQAASSRTIGKTRRPSVSVVDEGKCGWSRRTDRKPLMHARDNGCVEFSVTRQVKSRVTWCV